MNFLRLLNYEMWANRRVIAALDSCDAAPAEALRWMAHVLAGLRVWELRLRGEDSSSLEIWPEADALRLSVDLGDVISRLEKLVEGAQSSGLSESEMAECIEYSNQHGLSYKTRVDDVLTHLFLHGAYHRGQIASAFRRAGLDPVNTDFITYVRELSGEEWKP